MQLQPCTDPRCAVHARGADPAKVAAFTCARQVLRAYDRADAIVLLEQELTSPDVGGQRVVIPFQSSALAAGQSERIAMTKPRQPQRQPHTFRAERLFFSRASDLATWRIDDILMNGRSQLDGHGRLPAELFSSDVAGPGLRAFDRIEKPLEIEIVVTRTSGEGPATLIASVVGFATYESRVMPMKTDLRVKPNLTAQITETCTQSLQVFQFLIEDGIDWLIHDLRVDGQSLFQQKGDIPGDMFASDAITSFVDFGVFRADSRVEIQATYIGADPEGKAFVGEFRGQEAP